jgi:hypothetical protein
LKVITEFAHFGEEGIVIRKKHMEADFQETGNCVVLAGSIHLKRIL